jgi:hypothetical protein
MSIGHACTYKPSIPEKCVKTTHKSIVKVIRRIKNLFKRKK